MTFTAVVVFLVFSIVKQASLNITFSNSNISSVNNFPIYYNNTSISHNISNENSMACDIIAKGTALYLAKIKQTITSINLYCL